MCKTDAECFPMGNVIEPSNKRRIVWQKAFYFQSFRLQLLSTEKNEQKEIGSSMFRMFSPRRYCRYRIYLFIYFAHHFHSLATHLLVRYVALLRCPLSLSEALFLRLLLFSLRRCWVASLGRSALALVPELHVSSFRHAAWLNFAGFRSSVDFFAYRILLFTIVWHRRKYLSQESVRTLVHAFII